MTEAEIYAIGQAIVDQALDLYWVFGSPVFWGLVVLSAWIGGRTDRTLDEADKESWRAAHPRETR